MAKRKTVNVREIIDTVNKRNAGSICDREVRAGWNSLLEVILMACGQYRGFRYMTQDEVPQGHKPGIVFDAGGWNRHEFPDDSRRHYFYSQDLVLKGDNHDGDEA